MAEMFSCRDRNDVIHILEILIGNRETEAGDGVDDESVNLERNRCWSL